MMALYSSELMLCLQAQEDEMDPTARCELLCVTYACNIPCTALLPHMLVRFAAVITRAAQPTARVEYHNCYLSWCGWDMVTSKVCEQVRVIAAT